MKDFREYLFPILLIVLIYAVNLMFSINVIFAWILLVVVIYLSVDTVFLYLNYIWWPYQKWISLNTVDLEDIDIETTKTGEMIKAVVIRPLNMDKAEKHIGVLFHHGNHSRIYHISLPNGILGFMGMVGVYPPTFVSSNNIFR